VTRGSVYRTPGHGRTGDGGTRGGGKVHGCAHSGRALDGCEYIARVQAVTYPLHLTASEPKR